MAKRESRPAKQKLNKEEKANAYYLDRIRRMMYQLGFKKSGDGRYFREEEKAKDSTPQQVDSAVDEAMSRSLRGDELNWFLATKLHDPAERLMAYKAIAQRTLNILSDLPADPAERMSVAMDLIARVDGIKDHLENH